MNYEELEKWVFIPRTDKHYQVSNLGRVRSVERKTSAKGGGTRVSPSVIRAEHHDKDGYRIINLSIGGKQRTIRVHQEVLKGFAPGCSNPLLQVNHRNGNRADNRIANLEWVTCGENIRHAHRTIPRETVRGDKSPLAKLTKEQVEEIRRRYIPQCLHNGGAALSRQFQVSKQTISDIVHGRKYA